MKNIKNKIEKAAKSYFEQHCIAMQFENENNKIEWAISFDGINPKAEDFFVMNSEKEAILLSERINKI